MLRTDPAVAESEMRAAGAIPTAPFPGVNKPWPCIHDACSETISPRLANVRRGTGVCRKCAGFKRGAARKASLAEAAVALLGAAGWEALEPYPGAQVPWLMKHRPCGTLLRRSLDSVRGKPSSCMKCFRTERGYRSWTPESALELMRSKGLMPVEPYPGSSSKPWRAVHEECGSQVAPRLANIAAGQGPCEACGYASGAVALRMDHDVATVLMKAVGLSSVEPFRGVDYPWRCVHIDCGGEVTPSYTNIKRGQGGCGACGNAAASEKLRMPEPEAVALMAVHGLTPIEPYRASWIPWRSEHACGRIVSPTLSNVRSGLGICRYCNSSFPFDGEAELYLVADSRAMKIGCASRGGKRVADHVRMGWAEVWRLGTETGDAAYALEQGVLRWWREELSAPAYYARKDMPQWGASETIAWEAVQPSSVLSKALALANGWGYTISLLSSTPVSDDIRPMNASTNLGPRARRKMAVTEAQPTLF